MASSVASGWTRGVRLWGAGRRSRPDNDSCTACTRRGPKPGTVASRPSMAAACRSASVSIPSCSWMLAASVEPMPGTVMNTRSGRTSPRSRCSRFRLPVSTICSMARASDWPMAGRATSASIPSRSSRSATGSGSPRTVSRLAGRRERGRDWPVAPPAVPPPLRIVQRSLRSISPGAVSWAPARRRLGVRTVHVGLSSLRHTPREPYANRQGASYTQVYTQGERAIA